MPYICEDMHISNIELIIYIGMYILRVTDYSVVPKNFLMCLASGDGSIRFDSALCLLLRTTGGNKPEGWPKLELDNWWLPVGVKTNFGGRAWHELTKSGFKLFNATGPCEGSIHRRADETL